MKYSGKKLLNLLRAGDEVLKDPQDDAVWGRYLRQLDEIEREEAAQLAAASSRAPRLITRLPASLLAAVAVIALVGIWFLRVREEVSMGLSDPTPTPSLAHETLIATPTLTLTPDPRPTLAAGQMAGELTAEQLTAQHILAGHAGDSINVRLDAVGFDPYLTLLGVDGTELISDDDCGVISRACIEHILPADGIYTLVVDSFDRRSFGTYTLEVEIDSTATAPPDWTVMPTSVTANCPAANVVGLLVTDQTQVNLRNGPNASFTGAGIAYPGECFEAVGRNADSTWIKIRLSTGRQAWLLARFLQITGDAASLQVLDQ